MKDDDNFIQINKWMIRELDLKGNELFVYAMIHSFCRDGCSTFRGSLEYLSEELNITKQALISILNKLLAKKLIVKAITKRNGSVKYCEYYTLKSREKKQKKDVNPASKESLPATSKETLPNNNTNKTNYNTTTSDNNKKAVEDLLLKKINELFGENVFSADIFSNLADNLINFKKIPKDDYCNYINWAYEYLKSKCKNPENFTGYFYKSICEFPLLNQFCLNLSEIKKKKAEEEKNMIVCKICGAKHDILGQCSVCGSSYQETKNLSEKELEIKRKYHLLSFEEKENYENEVRFVYSQYPNLFQIFRDKKLSEEIHLKLESIDRKYGLIDAS